MQRRQDGNYNGTYPQYMRHVQNVGDAMEKHFTFTGEPAQSTRL